MCGILCSFCKTNKLLEVVRNLRKYVFLSINFLFLRIVQQLELFRGNIQNRGPDSFEIKTQQYGDVTFLFAASVLWLQGQDIVAQPLENEKSIFLYNGDIFGGITIKEQNMKETGDTGYFLKKLEAGDNIIESLASLEGPYAFIFFNKEAKQLYFARDHFGRRSLLLGKHKETLTLCSVAKRTTDFKFIEIPTIGVFCYDLNVKGFKLFPWQTRNKNFITKFKELETFLNANVEIIDTFQENNYKQFHSSTHTDINKILSLTKTIDTNMFEELLNDPDWLKNITQLENLLKTAVKKRIATQPPFCTTCISNKASCSHAVTGVLFSGGVDCAILSLLADDYTEKHRPIDLINVAFDRNQDYKTPDRLTGLQTLEELKKLRPDRMWNFLEINVTQEELNEERTGRIADLIYPLNSVLDDSLGCALWFASRALKNDGYKSPCRVLLVGMGADELFGGYTKHRNALKRNGWQGLYDVLEEDWQNLPHRNLARDDRVVSDHSRQLRTPYLDENVVEFVKNLNVWEKTCPVDDLPQGVGEKLLLRSLAYYLGLKEAAVLKKRALQFGSRIANGKENANDVSHRLLY